jgi:hypothetical protein
MRWYKSERAAQFNVIDPAFLVKQGQNCRLPTLPMTLHLHQKKAGDDL